MKKINICIMAMSVVLVSTVANASLTYTAGLDVWLDASNLDGSNNSTLTDGQSLSTWVNTGSANDGVVIGGGTTYSAGAGNGGQDALTLNNTRHQFGGEWGDSADVTMYFVVNRSAASGAEGTLLCDYGDTQSELRMLRTGAGSLGAYTRDAGGDNISVSPATTLADQAWATIFYSFDSGSGTVTYGELGSTATAQNAAYDPNTTFEGTYNGPVSLFSWHDGNDGNDFNGMVSEVLIYDHLLDATAQTTVESYLAAKAIPEPATLGMIALFGGGMLFIRRKLAM